MTPSVWGGERASLLPSSLSVQFSGKNSPEGPQTGQPFDRMLGVPAK